MYESAWCKSKKNCPADCAVHDFDVCTCIFDKPQVKQDFQQNFASVYEVTLTTTKDDPYELRQWVKKIADSAMYGVVDMPYCIELTQAGLPHIHAILYSSKKYCDGTKLKKLKFPYRYEFKRVRNLEQYVKYVHKENGNNLILDYCQRKGIQQFDNGVSKEKIQQAQNAA